MAALLLSSRLKLAPPIGEKWVQRFIDHHEESKSNTAADMIINVLFVKTQR